MSDSKRATLITVGAPKSAKNKVTKTVRLTINLDESNESKYPELNYKGLVITEERKKRVENGKTAGLDPFSDNDDDVERVARKFEQKYGGKSTYGRRGRTKRDDFADIGAGYDENDSFIDNTHGYDEMIPPECDTLYGGFYINSGSLEFKTVPDGESANSDGEAANRRSKRRISSSSSEDESSESSSESESQDEKDPKAIANGTLDSHKTEHRKKKNKKIDKKKANKIRRTDSSAATSGKQTSDDNAPADAESADSRTSQSDSLASKPAPSSENAATSDSSRDVDAKVKLPQLVCQALVDLESVSRQLLNAKCSSETVLSKSDPYIDRLERALAKCSASCRVQRHAWSKAARLLRVSRPRLLQRARPHSEHNVDDDTPTPTTSIAQSNTANPVTTTTSTTTATTTTTTTTTTTATTESTNTTTTSSNKRKYDDDIDLVDISRLTADEKEAKIVETLQRLKTLIDERKPGMMASYNAECERVQEERKKNQVTLRLDGMPVVEKRLPKRRFPWCTRSRALLARLARLAGPDASELLGRRALPLFPKGFVRMPTLLRQADLSKEMKTTEAKRQRINSVSQPTPNLQPTTYPEQIQFPSSLTVTTSLKATEKQDIDDKDSKYKINPAVFGKIINSYTIGNDLTVEKADDKKKEATDKSKEDLYIPSNNIGCITITPVPNQPKTDKKPNSVIVTDKKESLIRVKSPAALNDMIGKKDKHKKPEKLKEKRVASPLLIDTSYQLNKKEPTPSPKLKAEEVSQKQIENMRTAENNLPRPALIPVHLSPTFAKPDKRPPEVKKKKDVVIVSDVDPLGDIQQEPLAVDDSSSDVEVVEEKSIDKSENSKSEKNTVPLKDKVCVRDVDKKVNSVKVKDSSKDGKETRKNDSLDETTKAEMDNLMRSIIAMEHSQEPPKLNCNSYGGVITSAKHEKSSNQNYNARNAIFGEQRSDKDKFSKRGVLRSPENFTQDYSPGQPEDSLKVSLESVQPFQSLCAQNELL